MSLTITPPKIVNGELDSLVVSGNSALNGTANTAPNQTAESATSLMTRALLDARLGPLWVPLGGRSNNAQADGSWWTFTPWGSDVTGYCIVIPGTHVQLQSAIVDIAFSGSPLNTNFSITLGYGNLTGSSIVSGGTTQSLTGTVAQISGNRYKWVLDSPTTLTPDVADGRWSLIEFRFNNSTGGSLTTTAGISSCSAYMLLTR